MASVVSVTSFAGPLRTVSIVGGVIGGFIVLVFLIICALQVYKMHQDQKQKSGAVWSVEDPHGARKQQQQSPNGAPRITSGEFYMNYLEYGDDESKNIAPPSSSQLSVADDGKFRPSNVTALSTEDGDVWRQHNQL
jgi:hypothetical protein